MDMQFITRHFFSLRPFWRDYCPTPRPIFRVPFFTRIFFFYPFTHFHALFLSISFIVMSLRCANVLTKCEKVNEHHNFSLCYLYLSNFIFIFLFSFPISMPFAYKIEQTHNRYKNQRFICWKQAVVNYIGLSH